MPAIRWGAVLIGAMAGLGITAAIALGLFLVGIRPSADASGVVYIFGSFFGQLAAGYVGGRFAAPTEAYHGSLAGLLLFALTAVLTLASGGVLGLAALLFGGVVALVLGSAGGVLAGQQRRA